MENFIVVKYCFSKGVQRVKVFSVSEFGEWYCNTAFREFVFSTSNQSENKYGEVRFSLRFNQIIVHPEIKQVYFRNYSDALCLDQVKEVHMYDDMGNFAAYFDVVYVERNTKTEMAIRFLAI